MSSKARKAPIDSPTEDKKHRKGHKHHKKHHKRHENESEVQTNSSEVTPLKLTIKIGGQTLGEKSVSKSSIRALNTVSNQSNDENSNEDQLDLSMDFDEEDDNMISEDEIPVPDMEEEEEPDEEEEWLDALEEGRLHEVDDELKKIRDPKLMTARQRALLENKSLKVKSESIKANVTQESDLKTMSEEMIERKLIKDRRRRQQAEEKKEKDKKQTIDRLLRKRQELAQKARKKKRVETPKITYRNANGAQEAIRATMPGHRSKVCPKWL